MILASSNKRQGHVRKGHLKGFTLIELLVVIAIIGILSAVVLASLNTARAKGTDASIKSDLNTAQTQAALDYDAFPNGYATSGASYVAPSAAVVTTYIAGTGQPGATNISVFGTTASLVDLTAANALLQAAKTTGGGIQYGYGPTTYVIQAQLTAATGSFWCVDSTGNAKAETALLSTTATACP